MITDDAGKEVQLIRNVRYTNVVTVKYEDGTEKEIALTKLRSTLSRQDLIAKIQKMRVEE